MFIYISSNICSLKRVKHFNTLMNMKCAFVTLLDSVGRYYLTLCITVCFKWGVNPHECHHEKHLVKIMFSSSSRLQMCSSLSDFWFLYEKSKVDRVTYMWYALLCPAAKAAIVSCVTVKENIFLAPPLGSVGPLTWVR